jgi:exodeoxyribonuclease-3
MRVVTLNCNGIRSAARKGVFLWLAEQDADVVCLQETKAQEHQLSGADFALAGYGAVFADAQRKGYSGVAIYSKREPERVSREIGWPEIDAEGRYVQADFGNLSIASVYVPSGVSGLHRQAFKMTFLERFKAFTQALLRSGRRYIICGDYNIAHRDIDTYDPVRNQRITGFLPEERHWIDGFLDSGWCDAFRTVNPKPRQYTWWSNFPGAWQNNLGWRIDYQMTTPDIRSLVREASIYTDARFSDHAPLTIVYDL